MCCGICVLWAWQGQRGSHEALDLETGRALVLEPNTKNGVCDKDIYILHINEAWGNGNQKGDVFGKKGWDQMPSRAVALLPQLLWAAGCEFTCLRGQLCDWCKKKRKGEKPKTQTTSPYHFGRYQFLLDCTIKALLIDLLRAKQILQVLWINLFLYIMLQLLCSHLTIPPKE